MKYLAFDTSSTYLTVIAKNGQREKKTFISECATSHSVLLMDEIQKTLSAVGLEVKDIDFCAVVTGPGSFTGIRIGVASAKGLVAPFGKKILQVTSFDVISYSVNESKILAVVNANHDNFYVCGYTDRTVTLQSCFLNIRELEKIEGYRLFSFEEIPSLSVAVADVCQGLENFVEENYLKAVDSDEVKPFYLRLSQAEEGRK
ncbi:MAG: tRNA (adenosine(37)-N6)-threonylcarbamoyltransferase complex dimerization subunit type 1 TsaB [Christensenellaceae bacterium]